MDEVGAFIAVNGKPSKYVTMEHLIADIYEACCTCMGLGIYIPSFMHPGVHWDYLSLDNVDPDDSRNDIYNYVFTLEDITGGIYASHFCTGLTLMKILELSNVDRRFAFESSAITWMMVFNG